MLRRGGHAGLRVRAVHAVRGDRGFNGVRVGVRAVGGGRRRCLRLGLGAQPAGPAAVAGQGLGRDGRLLGQVVVDVTAAAG